MDPRRPSAVGRTPSPGHPLQGYQLEDTAYHPARPPPIPLGGALEIPTGPGTPSDRLAAQPTVSTNQRAHMLSPGNQGCGVTMANLVP